MSANGTYLIVTSSFETPPFFSHLRTPISAMVLGLSIKIVLPTRSRGLLMDLPLPETSADVGFFGSYERPGGDDLDRRASRLEQGSRAGVCAAELHISGQERRQ